MSRSLLIAVLAATCLVANPGAADAQGRLDPRRAARSLIDASVGYALVGGDLADSLKAGPVLEASYQYQLDERWLLAAGFAAGQRLARVRR